MIEKVIIGPEGGPMCRLRSRPMRTIVTAPRTTMSSDGSIVENISIRGSATPAVREMQAAAIIPTKVLLVFTVSPGVEGARQPT